VHSQYRRRLDDLPAAGVRIALILRTRRFFCDAKACARRIFAERFEAVEPRGRRTSRLDDIIHRLAIALGGRPAASLSRRLNVVVSNDTLLRLVGRRGPLSFSPTIVGIDDWAWRRNHPKRPPEGRSISTHGLPLLIEPGKIALKGALSDMKDIRALSSEESFEPTRGCTLSGERSP
jgi:hypothetical protein